MPSSLPSLDSINYTLAILSIVGIVGGWWISGRGKRKAEREQQDAERERRERADNAILGEAAIRDASGNIMQRERPGLVARTATLEQLVGTLVDQDSRMSALEQTDREHAGRLAEHDASIAALLAHTIDRAAETNLRAAEKANEGVIDVDPTQ